MFDSQVSGVPQFASSESSSGGLSGYLGGRPDVRVESERAEARLYIRHPRGFPIHYQALSEAVPGPRDSQGFGCGICFESTQELHPGTVLNLSLEVGTERYQIAGEVNWVRAIRGRFEVGVGFYAESARFRARMVEQLCHIEQYRESVQRLEGRSLSGDGAAAEWISRYAGLFPPV